MPDCLCTIGCSVGARPILRMQQQQGLAFALAALLHP